MLFTWKRFDKVNIVKIFMHTDCLNERGVSASVFEYSKHLGRMGHETNWFFCELSKNNDFEAVRKFSRSVEITPYKNFRQVANQARWNFDLAYFQKFGRRDEHFIPEIPNAVHAIFNVVDLHGDYFAYVSQWLARTATRLQSPFLRSIRRRIQNPFTSFKFVPYCVDLPIHSEDARLELGIPSDAFVAVTIGGKNSFDIPWVKAVLRKLIEEEKDFYFIGVNTEKFLDHRRAIFLPVTLDKERKVELLNTGNVFIHARLLGESFGMALLEAMHARIPILSWRNGLDRNHITMLHGQSLYSSPGELVKGIADIRQGARLDSISANYMRALEFSPERVMKIFCQVFQIKV